jgi:NADH-quinone oxidoreductase subunit G
MGLALMGGGSLDDAFRAVREGAADTVIVLENDLYRRADAAAVDAFLEAARHVIVIDHLAHATAAKAEVVLPAATFAEGDGTLVNNEGRAQRFYQVFVPGPHEVGGYPRSGWCDIQESWRWLRDLMIAAGRIPSGREAESWLNLDGITAAMIEALPVFGAVAAIAPPAGFRIAGERIPREPHRYSGRTAMTAHLTVHEPAPPGDADSPLAFSMEGFEGEPPPALITRFWSPGWNSVQALNKFQSEVGGPLRGGNPGRRLIEPAGEGEPAFFSAVPPAFAPRPDEWLVVPLHHLFGSEELSVLTPGVAELAPKPYLALHPEDAARLPVGEGEEIELAPGGVLRRLPVRLMPSLPRGVAGLPVGLPGLTGITLPAWSSLRRSSGRTTGEA